MTTTKKHVILSHGKSQPEEKTYSGNKWLFLPNSHWSMWSASTACIICAQFSYHYHCHYYPTKQKEIAEGKGPSQNMLEGTACLGHMGSIQLILLPAFSIYTNNPAREKRSTEPRIIYLLLASGSKGSLFFFFCCNVTSYLHFCYNRVVQERGKSEHNHLVLAKIK